MGCCEAAAAVAAYQYQQRPAMALSHTLGARMGCPREFGLRQMVLEPAYDERLDMGGNTGGS